MTNLTFTEIEAIHYCIGLGTRASQRRLETFKRLGKLDGKSSINSLIADLETDFKNVELGKDENGKIYTGLDRQYDVSNKRGETAQRKDNYNGQQLAKEQDVILKEYVFNRLCLLINELDYKDTDSITGWTRVIDVYGLKNGDRKKISELYKGYYSNKEAESVTSSLFDRLNNRNRSTVELALNQLKKEGRIESKIIFFASDPIAYEISEEFYNLIQTFIKKELEKLKVNYNNYVTAKINPSKRTEEMEEVFIKISDSLKNKYDIDGIFKAVKIEIIKDITILNVTQDDKDKAYIEKLLKLTRQINKTRKKKKDSVSGFVEKEFHVFNLLLMLREIIGVEGLDDEINSHTPKTEEIEVVQSIKRDYAEEQNKQWWIDNSGF